MTTAFAGRAPCSSEVATADALARIAATDGEGVRTFTQVYETQARAEAVAADRRCRNGVPRSGLDGRVVAVKDLFDVAGQTTWAGSLILRDAPPAPRDAPAVARLRAAGAVIIGKTNMTEFAYSGLGLNPHFGTPANPYDRGRNRRIPGGSSSGAAVAVSDGMAELSLGTDTGGSVRIPAAFCGVVGWKPTARRISLEGVWPLAPSLDSVGVIASSVEDCGMADAIVSGTALEVTEIRADELQLARLRGFVERDLDSAVARAYERALAQVVAAGATVNDIEVAEFERLTREPFGATIAAYEAFRVHAAWLDRHAALYDARVRARLENGRGVTEEQYATALSARRELQGHAAGRLRAYDGWLLPTVARVAPTFAELSSDADYVAVNRAVLRNTALVNFLDGCAISLPCPDAGGLPVGLSIAGISGSDARVLSAARTVARVLGARADTL